jgi:hypothetical protein
MGWRSAALGAPVSMMAWQSEQTPLAPKMLAIAASARTRASAALLAVHALSSSAPGYFLRVESIRLHLES